MNNFVIRNEASFLYNAAFLCQELKTGHDGSWQVAPFQCSIPHTDNCLENISRTKIKLKARFPELFDFGALRAQKAYNSSRDTITKPSYNMRIENYLGNGIDQLQNIAHIGGKEINSGGLVFSVFSPDDLIDRYRPGYTPCLIAGSFLEHQGELQLNAFFRSQSVVEFGIFDLEFLRKLQLGMIRRISEVRVSEIELSPGSLNLHFARILVQRRFCRNRRGHIRRDEILSDWLALVEEASYQ